jgi:23S rRNA pseudouridine1911/1915/1917 synthase
MIKEKHSFVIVDGQENIRLDLWVKGCFSELSRSFIQSLILEGKISVNDKKTRANYRLRIGDSICIYGKLDNKYTIFPSFLKLDILYEDKDLIVVNKPSGVVVHPGAGISESEITLVHGLLYHIKAYEPIVDNLRPGVVHRLDKDTSGVLVWAKNSTALDNLSKQFKEKTNKRKYIALLDGCIDKRTQMVSSFIGRDLACRTRFKSYSEKQIKDQNKQKYKWSSSTFIRKKVYNGRLSKVEVVLDTGRTHQIRVHSVDLGCPVVGDPLYNRKNLLPKSFSLDVHIKFKDIKRQMLHAYILGFNHPRSGEYLEFSANIPDDFKSFLDAIEDYNDLD